VFFIVVSFVMLFMALFTAKVLLPKRIATRVGLLLFAMMYVAVIARISIATLGHSDLLTYTAWFGYVSIGVVSMLFCAATVQFYFGLTGALIARSTDKFSPSRRAFLTKTLGTSLSVAVVPMAGYGVYRAVGEPVLKRVSLNKQELPKSLDGFKIVQLSDIHVGPTIGAETLEAIVNKTNELNPDLVLITGDLVDGSAKFISDFIKPLEDITSTHGTYFVTGNHEYYSGVEDWIKEVEKRGVQVLDNSNVTIKHGDSNVLLAGVPDSQADSFGYEGPNPEKAKQTDDSYDYSIVMSHRPEIADEIAKSKYDLMVSGHTHGGQYFPWTMAIHLVHKYVRGLYDVNGMKLYVSQGTAYWGPPIRIGAESEITEIVLKA
jgi:predicted MPP superfamily phosphohydrolase